MIVGRQIVVAASVDLKKGGPMHAPKIAGPASDLTFVLPNVVQAIADPMHVDARQIDPKGGLKRAPRIAVRGIAVRGIAVRGIADRGSGLTFVGPNVAPEIVVLEIAAPRCVDLKKGDRRVVPKRAPRTADLVSVAQVIAAPANDLASVLLNVVPWIVARAIVDLKRDDQGNRDWTPDRGNVPRLVVRRDRLVPSSET